MRRWLSVTVPLALALLVAAAAREGFADYAAVETLAARCDYGIASAFRGDTTEAERAFLALLSGSPRDARALTNLGNLRLLGGNPAAALAFYDEALRRDSTDAGIVLDRAISLMVLGRDAEARAEATRGVELAGGPDPALSLLAVRGEDAIALPPRASDVSARTHRVWAARAEVARHLGSVGGAGARDSARVRVAAATRNPRIPDPRSIKSSGVDEAELAGLLYWKR